MSMAEGGIQGSGFGIQGPVAGVPGLAARLAATAIRGYQRWLSPYKGFRCAHRCLHGGHSCSEFTRLVILDRGLIEAWPDIRRQFRECRAAFLFLRQQHRSVSNSTDSDPDQGADGDGYELEGQDESNDESRTFNDRFYEESEKKRKRLAELPSNESTMSNLHDWCFACGTCGFLEPFLCCGPW